MTPRHLPLGPVMVDISALSLSPDETELLLHPAVGAVILFSRNYDNPEQLSALCQHIHRLRSPKLLIAVDHEGGRVQRFRQHFTAIPPMATLGQRFAVEPELALLDAERYGEVLATELAAVGVDFSFTPVLDLDFSRSSVIGDRAFAADPVVVGDLALALRRGLNRGGMVAVGKHFPGHGWVEADSHHELPRDERDLASLLSQDLIPFKQLIGAGLEAIMPAHVVYPACDAHPAGFSAFWLQQVLRQKLGFGGVIFSDDLAMAGAVVAGDIHQRAEAAFAAGCDMVLVCNQPEQAWELVQQPRPSWPQSSLKLEQLAWQRGGR